MPSPSDEELARLLAEILAQLERLTAALEQAGFKASGRPRRPGGAL